MTRENHWAVFNPTGKTNQERKRVRVFDSLEDAQAWVADARRAKHGYIIRFIPCVRENDFSMWRADFPHPIVKEILKTF